MDKDRAIRNTAGALKTVSVAWFVLLSLHPAALPAQLSGYLSSTYGFDNNPLANSYNVSDHLTQGFLQLNYETEDEQSLYRIGYMGVLQGFHQLQERTYYEHIALGSYAYSTESDSAALADSTGGYFEAVGKYMARYDRIVAQEFDNTGVVFVPSYKFSIAPSVSAAVQNDLHFRTYQYVESLSNLTDWLTIEFGNRRGSSFRYGGTLSAGVKYYTNNVFDTTRFDVVVPDSGGNMGKGKGKGKGNPGNGGGVQKKTLLQPRGNTTTQIALGCFAARHWDGGFFEGTAVYRTNPKWVTRTIVHDATSTQLSEDIYNDFLSYEGFEETFRIRNTLPFGFTGNIILVFQQKKYGIPALTLDEIQTAPNRQDYRYHLESTISRSIALSDIFSIDIAANLGVIRNSSNDEYNDFSGYSVSVSMGVGF